MRTHWCRGRPRDPPKPPQHQPLHRQQSRGALHALYSLTPNGSITRTRRPRNLRAVDLRCNASRPLVARLFPPNYPQACKCRRNRRRATDRFGRLSPKSATRPRILPRRILPSIRQPTSATLRTIFHNSQSRGPANHRAQNGHVQPPPGPSPSPTVPGFPTHPVAKSRKSAQHPQNLTTMRPAQHPARSHIEHHSQHN